MKTDRNGYIDGDSSVWKVANATNLNGKIYFGFLSTGGINAARLWRLFFETAEANGMAFEIGVHCDKPFSNAYFAPFVLEENAQTTWAQTVEAQTLLIKDAAAKGCDKFVLLSDSCVPLSTPLAVWGRLLASDYSFIQPVKQVVLPAKDFAALPSPPPQFYYTQQWFCADKKDFHLWDGELVRRWFKVWVGNEKYLYSLFHAQKALSGLMVYHYHHTSWSGSVKRNSPRVYMPIHLRKLAADYELTATFDRAVGGLLWGRFLFGRKFGADCDFSVFEERLI